MWEPLARAIAATGTDRHIDSLIDAIGVDVPHDLVTVTRYSATRTPEFVKHRRFSDEMVRHYLASYYVYDPFYAHWRRERRLGVVPLRSLADDEVKRGQYMAGFLAQSEIFDEVGVLLEDGCDLSIVRRCDRRVARALELGGALREHCPASGLQAGDELGGGALLRDDGGLPLQRERPRLALREDADDDRGRRDGAARHPGVHVLPAVDHDHLSAGVGRQHLALPGGGH